MKTPFIRILVISLLISTVFLAACSSGGGRSYSGHTRYGVGVGYGGYYGRPWDYHPGYIGGIDPDPGLGGGPVASQMPDMGMPDFGGGMDMGMGMGGFDF